MRKRKGRVSKKRLDARIADWERTISTIKTNQEAYRKPGSNKK